MTEEILICPNCQNKDDFNTKNIGRFHICSNCGELLVLENNMEFSYVTYES